MMLLLEIMNLFARLFFEEEEKTTESTRRARERVDRDTVVAPRVVVPPLRTTAARGATTAAIFSSETRENADERNDAALRGREEMGDNSRCYPTNNKPKNKSTHKVQ